MRNLLLDTNILVYISGAKNTDRMVDFVAADGANLYVSVVTVAEMRSLAVRNRWGSARQTLIESFWDKVNIVEITQLYVNVYSQIDAYSQRLNSDFAEYPRCR